MNATPTIASIASNSKPSRPRTKIHDSPAVGPVERGGRPGKAPLALLILLAGFIVLQAYLPLGTAVQIGADEGFELAKAMLGLHGHGLYTEAWNDQPPLHTFLVVQVLKYLSPGVLGPRLVTVIAAAVLLAGMFWFTYRVGGLAAASFAVALVVVSPGFLELSASCMLEIPALAPAVVALGVLVGEGRSKKEEGRRQKGRVACRGDSCGVSVWGGVVDQAGAGGVAAVGGAGDWVAELGRRTVAPRCRGTGEWSA